MQLILEAQAKIEKERTYTQAWIAHGVDLRAEEEKARVAAVKKRAEAKLEKINGKAEGQDFFADIGIEIVSEE